MPTLTITKSYSDGSVLNESDLDNIKDGIETFLNTTKIDSDNIQTDGIIAGNLASNSVTADKISTSAVSELKIADGAVTGDKIGSSAVTAIKIKRGSATYSSGTSASELVSQTSFVNVSGLSASFTCYGGPVFVGLTSLGTTAAADLRYNPNGIGGSQGMYIEILRDSSVISTTYIVTTNAGNADQVGVGAPVWVIDTPTSGTYTYSVEARVSVANQLGYLANLRLIAIEL